MIMKQLAMSTLLALCCTSALANTQMGIYFHPYLKDKAGDIVVPDWVLTCDNINTCRATGYSKDGEENGMSLLLKRTNTGELTGKIALNPNTFEDLDNPFKNKRPTLMIGGKNFGKVKIANDQIKLTQQHINALKTALQQGNFALEVRLDDHRWQLSDVGLKETLTKMDSVQALTGTRVAFFNQGNQAITAKAQNYPTLDDKPILSDKEIKIERDSTQGKQILALLRDNAQTLQGEEGFQECTVLAEDEDVSEYDRDDMDFSVLQVAKDKKLILGRCWRGAYNMGMGAWLTDNQYKTVHQAISTMINDWESNQLFGYHKGRGIGDCLSEEGWTWNGTNYVQTYDGHTGLCRGFVGGAWTLPALFIDVKSDKDDQAEFW